MYPPDVLKKVEAQEITAEQAERATRDRLMAYVDILWPDRTWQLTALQYEYMRRFVYDPLAHRSFAQ